jgi:hypothetical protein
MKYVVKLAIRDWPKRTDFMRQNVTVDASDDVDARHKALKEASIKWPHGKLAIFDVIMSKDAPRETLTVKRSRTAAVA